MVLDPLVPGTGKLHEQLATGTPPPETDEDLFNFVELHQQAAPKPALPASAPTAAAAPSTLAQVEAPTESATGPASGTTAVPVGERAGFSMSPLATALFAAVLVANVALMAFAWNSVSATRDLVLDVAHDVREASTDLRNESNQRTATAARASEPAFGALPEGFRTLEIARERIAQGEHVRARRMLQGLLSVIDRVEPPAREEIEAQAGFLIADSYRLEADTLARGTEERR